MAEIAAAAKVGRATLHRHFPTRDDLITRLTEHGLAEIDDAVAQAVEGAESYLEGLRLAMRACVPLADRQLFLARHTGAQAALVAEADAQGLSETRDAIEAAKAEGSLPTSVPTPWMARFYDTLIYIAWESVSAQELTPNQASDLAWQSFLTGVTGETQ